MNKEIAERFSYQNEYWAAAAGANIVEVIEEENTSADYEVQERHLFKLENGRFAVVEESGCSCYSLMDANIETFDTKEEAQAAYNALGR
jgi:hypothetical protein